MPAKPSHICPSRYFSQLRLSHSSWHSHAPLCHPHVPITIHPTINNHSAANKHPNCTRSATTSFFDPKYEGRETVYGQLSNEMDPYFVGLMPPEDFLDFFLPPTMPDASVPTFTVGMFSGLTKLTLEADMYDRFVSSNPLFTRSL
jgi:hypothetical protein